MKSTKEDVQPSISSRASFADKAGFYLLSISGVLAPIPYGSNTATTAGLIGILLAVSLLGATLVPPVNARARRLLDVLLALSGLLILWTVVQVLPWPSISAGPAIPLEVGPSAAGEAPSHLRLQPLHSIGYVLIPFAAFMAALIYVRDDARYTTFLHILLGSAFAVTTFCITEYLISPQTLLLQPKIHYLGSFTGTFVNPNTAASYFGIMLLLSLSLCLRQLDYVRRHRHVIRAAGSDPRLRNFLIYCAWTVTFAVALLLTRSRAGVLSSIVAVVGYTWAYAFSTMRDRGRSARSIAISTVGAAAAVALLLAPLAQRVMLRIENEGLWDTGRLCTYRSTWHAIQDHLWLGTGLGTFQDVFPAYRSPQCGLNGYWEMAHSVFLEAWLSLGAAFPVVLVIIYYQLIKTYAYGYRQRQRFRFVPLASLGILLLLTLHSLVDFSLQIPGIAVVAAIALGIGASVSLSTRTANGTSRQRSSETDN